MQIQEQELLIRNLQSQQQQLVLESDRRLTQQQQEHERKIQVLVRQLTETHAAESARSESNVSEITLESERNKDPK